MKYLPLRDFEDVTNALNFDTADCHVIGGCDLYTTKAAGGDKKLYKTIEQSLESQYESLLRLSASLSPPHASSAASSLNLSRSSPFGPLSQISSRRTFAYLIATLNASHPDYDFSHILRPTDFRREKSLKTVMNTLDTTLYNLRPRPLVSSLEVPSRWSASTAPQVPGETQIWGPRMWAIIDKEMTLKDCSIYCYSPEEDPYDGEEGAIWSFNYFFFNKTRKRVCYIYLRGLSVMSHCPVQRTPMSSKRNAWSALKDGDIGASKRAKYWLGDRANGEDVQGVWGEDDDDLTTAWEVEEDLALEGHDCAYDDVEDDDDDDDIRYLSKSTVRGSSEEVAGRMEI